MECRTGWLRRRARQRSFKQDLTDQHLSPNAAPTRQYLENAVGHRWLAQRVPDDKFFVSANQGRFQVTPCS